MPDNTLPKSLGNHSEREEVACAMLSQTRTNTANRLFTKQAWTLKTRVELETTSYLLVPLMLNSLALFETHPWPVDQLE